MLPLPRFRVGAKLFIFMGALPSYTNEPPRIRSGQAQRPSGENILSTIGVIVEGRSLRPRFALRSRRRKFAIPGRDRGRAFAGSCEQGESCASSFACNRVVGAGPARLPRRLRSRRCRPACRAGEAPCW